MIMMKELLERGHMSDMLVGPGAGEDLEIDE
jgi:hypothetical protein